jgi:hypothetical protein
LSSNISPFFRSSSSSSHSGNQRSKAKYLGLLQRQNTEPWLPQSLSSLGLGFYLLICMSSTLMQPPFTMIIRLHSILPQTQFSINVRSTLSWIVISSGQNFGRIHCHHAYCSHSPQRADLLTKALPSSLLRSHLLKLGIVNLHSPSCGEVLRDINISVNEEGMMTSRSTLPSHA